MGGSTRGAKGSRKKRQSLGSAKMLGFKPRSSLSASRENTSSAVGAREEGGRRRDVGRRHEVLTRCKVSRCRPLPAAPVQEAGGGSTEPYGGCHAAPAPPPRGDLRRSGSYTVCECARRDGQAKHRLGAAHARALPRGGHPPVRGGAQYGEAPPAEQVPSIQGADQLRLAGPPPSENHQ